VAAQADRRLTIVATFGSRHPPEEATEEAQRSLLREEGEEEAGSSPDAMRRRASMTTAHSRRQHILALSLLTLVAVSLVVGARLRYAPTTDVCDPPMPRVISHRGFDAGAGEISASAATVRRLIESGVRSFDLDLFWTADEPAQFYVGHPASLASRLKLKGVMSSHKSEALLERISAVGGGGGNGGDGDGDGGGGGARLPLSLSELIGLVSRDWAAVGAISLELKEPGHPSWSVHLRTVLGSLRKANVQDKFAFIADSPAQAGVHRRMQQAVGVNVPLHLVVRDVHAPRDAGGAPYANLTGTAALLAARNTRCNGWSVSAKLLSPSMGAEGEEMGMPVDVWVVDGDPILRRAVAAGVAGVVSNRPMWALAKLAEIRAELCAQGEGGRQGARRGGGRTGIGVR
jgi:glycerophosphoryl diester phosphodiesterase